jgi:peptide chain release factor
MEKQTKLVQITAGRGPVECCRVVAKVLELILKDASKNNITSDCYTENAIHNGTLYSATIKVESANVDVLAKQWKGTIQWIAQSPYRKYHKRKNWFVGVEFFDIENQIKWNEKMWYLKVAKLLGQADSMLTKQKVRFVERINHQEYKC